jgi:ribonuclease-3
VRGAVATLLEQRLAGHGQVPVDKDPKTALQEHLQARRLPVPRYSVQRTEGEAHEQTFTVECRVDDLGVATTGRGASRRAAEQAAAVDALARIEHSNRSGKP